MVKIFVGNLSESTTKDELQDLFSQYGKITECDIVKNFGFVHMEKESEAEAAISNLNQYELNGQPMNVERSKGKSKGRNRGSTKLYVSNISSECTNQELRAKFEEYGPVAECDIVKDYAFVHMEREDDALRAINGLDNSAFQGKLMKVQLSTSRLRTVPGMGDHTGCYVCGKPGHWSKDCPHGQNGSYDNGGGFRGGRGYPAGPPGYSRGGPGMRGPSDYAGGPMYSRAATAMSRYPAYGAARDYGSTGRDPYASRVAPSYGDRYASAYERDRYSLAVDYYEKYRARPYASSYLDDRRIPPPPPPPPSAAVLMRMRSAAAALDPYERSSLGSSASAAAAAYYARDRSPTRRASTGSVGGTASYSYERSRLSPVARASPYSVPRAREAYGERERYAY